MTKNWPTQNKQTEPHNAGATRTGFTFRNRYSN